MKRYRCVALICALISILNILLPFSKVQASTPDSPNLKTLSSLPRGTSIFFANIEWVLINPSRGELITRKSIFDLPLGLSKSGWSVESYDRSSDFLKNDFYNKLDPEDRRLITIRPNLLTYEELKELDVNTKNLITTESNIAIKTYSGEIRYYHYYAYASADDDYAEERGNYYTRRIETTRLYYEIDIERSYSDVKPAICISPSTKVFFNEDEDIGLVLGGKYNLSSPKGTTNKFYFYDRYAIEPKYGAIEGTYKFIDFISAWHDYRDGTTFEDAVKRYKSNYYNTPFYNVSNFNGKYYANGPGLIDRDILDSYTLRNFNIYNFSSNGTSAYRSGYPGGGYSTIYGYYDYWSGLYWTKRVCMSLQGINKGQQVGSYFLGKDNQYPINGPHTDGYWYIRREEANIEGIGEIDIENFSNRLKQDIMPLINVVVGKEFDEVVQGRTYLNNGTTIRHKDGTLSITKQGEGHIRLKGKFDETGVKLLKTYIGNLEAYFLINVMENPVTPSARGVIFK